MVVEVSVNRLGLRKFSNFVCIKGIGSTDKTISYGSVSVSIKPIGQFRPILNFETLILPKICDDLPALPLPMFSWACLKDLPLADPGYKFPDRIDILIGADMIGQVIMDGKIMGPPGTSVALNTIFGYVLAGKVGKSVSSPLSLLCTSFEVIPSTQDSFKQFWECEKVPHIQSLSPDDIQCDNTLRNADGRYIVSLPFSA